jgi:DNA-binding transcriptional regulator GbsR (MarR family)
MQSLARKPAVSVSCKVSPKTNGNNRKFVKRAQDAVKDFNKKRSTVAKENLNKLVSVSQQDVQELSDLFKELDGLHRTKFDEWKNAFKNATSQKDETSDADVDSDDDTKSVEVVVVEPVVGKEENIFVDK